MKINKVNSTKKIEIEKTIAKYSKEDIKELIKSDLISKGFEVEDINIITDYKYKSDEWGMNSHLVTDLESIEAVIIEEI